MRLGIFIWPARGMADTLANKRKIPEQYRESFREFIQVLKTREIHGIEPDDALVSLDIKAS